MYITIERLEGLFAVIELPDGEICSVPCILFPGAREGDVYCISKDSDMQAERQKRVQEKFDRLKSK